MLDGTLVPPICSSTMWSMSMGELVSLGLRLSLNAVPGAPPAAFHLVSASARDQFTLASQLSRRSAVSARLCHSAAAASFPTLLAWPPRKPMLASRDPAATAARYLSATGPLPLGSFKTGILKPATDGSAGDGSHSVTCWPSVVSPFVNTCHERA